jgi:hypothetical protein
MWVKYLDTMLRHNVGFFDMDGRMGAIVNSICSDTLRVQDAISEKVVLQPSSGFFLFIDSATQLLLHTFNIYTHPSFSKKNLFCEVHAAVKFRKEKECL